MFRTNAIAKGEGFRNTAEAKGEGLDPLCVKPLQKQRARVWIHYVSNHCRSKGRGFGSTMCRTNAEAKGEGLDPLCVEPMQKQRAWVGSNKTCLSLTADPTPPPPPPTHTHTLTRSPPPSNLLLPVPRRYFGSGS